MRVLFVGDEEDYRKATGVRADDSPPSFFFLERAPRPDLLDHWDAMVVPTAVFLADVPPLRVARMVIPVIASGPACLSMECFEAGCADFLREPWGFDELEARVRACSGDCFVMASRTVSVRVEKGRVCGPAGSAPLRDGAYDILAMLWRNAGRVVPRAAFEALKACPGEGSRALDMRMARLRSALRTAGAAEAADGIRAGRGGYSLIL